tara:strand:- start:1547 stop:2533 length:987 start_codon:yes stop_codon:yes gene_type:complete
MSYEYEKNRVLAKSEKNIDDTLGKIIGDNFVDYRKKWNEVNNKRNISEFPLYLVLEQRFKCNLKCPMCVISYPEKVSFDTDSSSMPDELFMKIMKEAQQYQCPSISMNNTEEPLLGKQKAIERIKIAKEHGFIDIMMNTNGVLLNEKISNDLIDSGLTRFLIGFDGHSKTTYEKVRVGANYHQVKANIEEFLKIKKERSAKLPIVRLSFVVNDINKHEVVDFYEYWKDKVDYVAFQEYYEPPVEGPLIINNLTINKDADCDEPWNRMTIRANGDVLPCCSFWGYYLPIGNLNQSSIYEIWHGKEMNKLRSQFINKDLNEICKKCLNAC